MAGPSGKKLHHRFGDAAFEWLVTVMLGALALALWSILQWFHAFPVTVQIATGFFAIACVAVLSLVAIRLHAWHSNRRTDLIFVLDTDHPFQFQDTNAVLMYRIGVRARNPKLALTDLQVKMFRFSSELNTPQIRGALAKLQGVPLMIGNDRDIPPRKVCDFDPGVTAFFEFVVQVKNHDWGKHRFHLCHACGVEPYNNEQHRERKLIYDGTRVRVPPDDVPAGRYGVTLFASAEDVPARYQDFDVRIKDGVLLTPSRFQYQS
jgi:hypothetical protein